LNFNYVLILLFILLIPNDAFADADARRRNSCLGFLSYRYKCTGVVRSMSPFHGCLCIIDYDEVDRNCSGAYLFKYQTALAYPNEYAIVQAISNSLNESSSEYMSDPGLIFAGGTNNTYGLHKNPSKIFNTNVSGKNKSVRNYVSIGRSFARDGSLVIKDLIIRQENGKIHEGTTVSQLLVFVKSDEKDLDELSEKIFEIRFEHKKNELKYFGYENFEKIKINSTEELSILDFSLEEIVIPLKGIDIDKIEIRTLTNMIPEESKIIKNKLEYNIYPNPIERNGYLNIQNPNKHLTDKIELYNETGEKVGSQQFNSNEETLIYKTGNQNSGIYYLVIYSESIIQRKRILIGK
jgi:hypothetical protein